MYFYFYIFILLYIHLYFFIYIFSGIPHMPTFPVTLHKAPGTSPKSGKWGMSEKSFQNAVQKSFFQVASPPQSKVISKA